jgi:hypothetical protein
MAPITSEFGGNTLTPTMSVVPEENKKRGLPKKGGNDRTETGLHGRGRPDNTGTGHANA